MLSTVLNSRLSSANSRASEDLQASGRSFMNARKSRGAKNCALGDS